MLNVEQNVIKVANKIDKLSPEQLQLMKCQMPDTKFVSAVNGNGLDDFVRTVEDEIILVTNRLRLCFQVPNGSEEYQ